MRAPELDDDDPAAPRVLLRRCRFLDVVEHRDDLADRGRGFELLEGAGPLHQVPAPGRAGGFGGAAGFGDGGAQIAGEDLRQRAIAAALLIAGIAQPVHTGGSISGTQDGQDAVAYEGGQRTVNGRVTALVVAMDLHGYQFSAGYPDRFTWHYLETGPEVWKVRTGRPEAV